MALRCRTRVFKSKLGSQNLAGCETYVKGPSTREWLPQELTATGGSGRGHSSQVLSGIHQGNLESP